MTPAMRNDRRFVSWLVQRNRKRRMAESVPPVVIPLAWKAAPPATATIGDKIVVSFEGGEAPWAVKIVGPVDTPTFDFQDGSVLEVVFDTASYDAGDYVWTLTDAKQVSLTATTTLS